MNVRKVWKETFFFDILARVCATVQKETVTAHSLAFSFFLFRVIWGFHMNGRFFNILYTCSYFVGLSISLPLTCTVTSLSLSCFLFVVSCFPLFSFALTAEISS